MSYHLSKLIMEYLIITGFYFNLLRLMKSVPSNIQYLFEKNITHLQ